MSNKKQGVIENFFIKRPGEKDNFKSVTLSSEINSEVISNSSKNDSNIIEIENVACCSGVSGTESAANLQEDRKSAPSEDFQKKDLLNEKCIQNVPGQKGKRKRIFCNICLPNPDILKRMCYRGRIPPICLSQGTEARSQTVQEHLQSTAHQECLKVERLKKLSAVEKSQTVPLHKMISSQRQKLANKIGSLMIQVYNDAKCLTLSECSWPSRVITSRIAYKFEYNEEFTPFTPSDFDLQYIRPEVVKELLRTIVVADLPRIKSELNSCIAATFRCDASMDKTQKDNEFMLLNVIKENGERDLKFIGIGHVTEPGAIGHLAALKKGASDTVGFEKILKIINHLSTDGENKNVGKHHGLWKLLDDEREKADIKFPLLKAVCAVHSSANAYKDLCKCVPEIDNLIKKLSGIASYFHKSAKRTTELEMIGKKEGLTVRRIQKYFEIRWSEFTSNLLDSILCSWQALIKYCLSQNDSDVSKYLKLLTNKDNIITMCFVADLLFVFKVFQKKLQSDSITIVDIKPEVVKFKMRMDRLSESSLIGGWEEAFKENFDEEANTFCGIEVWEKEKRKCRSIGTKKYITELRTFVQIRNESILSLKKFLDDRLDIDQKASKAFSLFTNFSALEEDIRDVHKSIAPDLDLANLAIQYQDVQDSATLCKDNPYILLQNLLKKHKEEYEDLSVVLGRILVCKPHSADCERIISLYNIVKSADRSLLNRQTISDYLYINMNMPLVSDFDPRPAVLHWLDEKNRRVRETPKAGQQNWFAKVFDVENFKEPKGDEKEKQIKCKF